MKMHLKFNNSREIHENGEFPENPLPRLGPRPPRGSRARPDAPSAATDFGELVCGGQGKRPLGPLLGEAEKPPISLGKIMTAEVRSEGAIFGFLQTSFENRTILPSFS